MKFGAGLVVTQIQMNLEEINLENEYRALRQGVGVLDPCESGLIELSGGNAVQFLNGLVSNDVKSLQTGDGVLVAFPNLQGKLLALARVYRDGEVLLLEVDEINREKIVRNLSRFVPAGNFFVRDLEAETRVISLQGPRTAELIASLTGIDIGGMDEYRLRSGTIVTTAVRIVTHQRCGEIGCDLFIPVEGLSEVRRMILEAGGGYGGRPVGREAFETARIEAGVAREGVDAGEEYIILETGLEEAISYTKGCYLGQEVIARIHWRGQPARQLRGLLPDRTIDALVGLELRAIDGSLEGRKVGTVTSATCSPTLARQIALGYVHRYYLTPGTVLEIFRDGAGIGRAVVTTLPFIAKSTDQATGRA